MGKIYLISYFYSIASLPFSTDYFLWTCCFYTLIFPGQSSGLFIERKIHMVVGKQRRTWFYLHFMLFICPCAFIPSFISFRNKYCFYPEPHNGFTWWITVFCIGISMTMPKPLAVWITINYGKFFKRWEYQTTWPASWETYMQVRKQQLELDMEQQTGSK